MTTKPVLITEEMVAEQAKLLATQKAELEITLDQLEIRLRSIEASLAENENLRNKNQEFLTRVLQNFEDEWNRRSDYFPDIHLRMLESTAALVAPPKK
jgi:hypothetical protein